MCAKSNFQTFSSFIFTHDLFFLEQMFSTQEDELTVRNCLDKIYWSGSQHTLCCGVQNKPHEVLYKR